MLAECTVGCFMMCFSLFISCRLLVGKDVHAWRSWVGCENHPRDKRIIQETVNQIPGPNIAVPNRRSYLVVAGSYYLRMRPKAAWHSFVIRQCTELLANQWKKQWFLWQSCRSLEPPPRTRWWTRPSPLVVFSFLDSWKWRQGCMQLCNCTDWVGHWISVPSAGFLTG